MTEPPHGLFGTRLASGRTVPSGSRRLRNANPYDASHHATPVAQTSSPLGVLTTPLAGRDFGDHSFGVGDTRDDDSQLDMEGDESVEDVDVDIDDPDEEALNDLTEMDGDGAVDDGMCIAFIQSCFMNES
jgi:hypothetical protein